MLTHIQELKKDEKIDSSYYGLRIRFDINHKGYEKGIKIDKEAPNSKQGLKDLVSAYMDIWKDRMFKIIDEEYK